MLTLTVLIWLALSIAVGVGATRRGRIGVVWFLISIVTSPLLALLLLLVFPPVAARGDDVLDRVRRTPD